MAKGSKSTTPAVNKSQKPPKKQKESAPVSSGGQQAAPSEKTEPRLTRFQKFEAITLHRSRLLNAPYNPRYMDKYAKKRLREVLRKSGLVEPPIWNKRTGNLVGGHQRLEQLDGLEESQDYLLTVAVVDVDEAKERELNIALNNPNIQGQFDMAMLENLLSTEGVDLSGAGFEKEDLQFMEGFSPSFLEQFLDGEAAEQAAAEGDSIDMLNEIRATSKELEKGVRGAGDGGEASGPDDPDASSPSAGQEGAGDGAVSNPDIHAVGIDATNVPDDIKAAIERQKQIDKMKELRKGYRQSSTNANDTDFYFLVTCKSREQCDELLAAFGLPLDSKYVPGEKLAAAIGVDLGGGSNIGDQSAVGESVSEEAGQAS